mmetsp:Transcript_37495/g.90443  ORF Transcript_37495/g.90443 Transcript_37495/m.90443 type:complete len:144 (-) Transcript_37495:121-552(-)
MEALSRALQTFHEKHEKIKHTVHNTWRYPLPKWGRYAMGCIYFTVPVVGGWYVMQWAISKSVDEIGERGEKLQQKELRGFGNKTVIEGKEETIGAGGKLGGVHLAVSDSSTQEKNKAMLESMFKQERKRRNKEKQQQQKDEER